MQKINLLPQVKACNAIEFGDRRIWPFGDNEQGMMTYDSSEGAYMVSLPINGRYEWVRLITSAEYIEYDSSNCVKCAVVTISNAVSNSIYKITHNLNTQNIVLNAYDITSGSAASVEISYSILNENNIAVYFDSFGDVRPNIRIVMMGSQISSTARVVLL